MIDYGLYLEAGHRVMDCRRPSTQEVVNWLLTGAPEPSEEERDALTRELWNAIEEEYNKLRRREHV